ncbi:MAG: septum formation family protein [Hamadaea sp.]|nr:septum formation family protein [Hamadaea sp.]
MTGRRKIVIATVALMAAVGLAGCGLPAGVDGELTNAWAAPPAPQLVEAKVGDCRVNRSEQASPIADLAVDCTKSHYREVVYIGTFTGESAGLSRPPRLTPNATGKEATAQAEAYKECGKQASAYVGHPWGTVHLSLEVVLPTDAAWQAGRKWFRCELQEIDWNSGDEKARTASLKGFSFPVTCMNFTSEEALVVDCAKRHNGEFVGVYQAPGSIVPKTDAQWNPYHAKCRALVGPYLGVAVSRVRYVTGTYSWFMQDNDYWSSGRQDILCFIWTGDKKYMTGSAKGKGGRNLP